MRKLYSGLIDNRNPRLLFMQHDIMAREDKSGGEESLADHVNCPTHHLSFSAWKASLSKTLQVCTLTYGTQRDYNTRQQLTCVQAVDNFNFSAESSFSSNSYSNFKYQNTNGSVQEQVTSCSVFVCVLAQSISQRKDANHSSRK